ncbi:lrr receptor-like serine/threonine-protein kinase efr [Quercus suber]|uniref:Lrr receptor-like serine/threonine-protein kinase efr n=1 Tax=Quercus suber TaxID=58331 RepID=A0AAW0L1N6_QUESU
MENYNAPKSKVQVHPMWKTRKRQSLSNNNLGRSLKFLTYLTNCSKLDLVDLRINRFGGVLPNSVANLSNQLTQLYLGENEISGTIPASLANLDKLIVLSLDDNHFTGIIPASFRRFQKLQVLLLTGNNLSGEIPTFIGNLTELFQLFLNENLFEGTIPPSSIANLSQMDANMHKCLVSILEIGLAFSMESPKERMKMEEVTRELHLIKNAYLGSGIHSGLSEIPFVRFGAEGPAQLRSFKQHEQISKTAQWGTFFFDVGASLKNCSCRLKEQSRAGRP